MLSLFNYMGTSRTSILVEHVYRTTELGNNIRVCIEDIVLDCGLYGLLWNMNFSDIQKYIEGHSWVYSILDYNDKNNIVLTVDHGLLKSKRKEDCAIMSKALDYFTSVTHLRSINRIRMSFQVHSLSEICSADGKQIMDEYSLNHRCRRVCNNHDWPVKYRTDIKDYRIWRQLLKHICHDTCKNLIHPLGVWDYHDQNGIGL